MFHAYRSWFAVLLLAMLVTACTPEPASENELLAQAPPETPPTFMVGHWAPDASSCPDMSWRITHGGLQTPGEVTCRFEELRHTPRGAEADAVCVAEGPPKRWNIQFAYAESARALLIEDAPFADTGLVRCDENAADIETGALSANGQKAADAVQAYFSLLAEGSADAARRFLASEEAEGMHEALARQLAGRASEDIATGPAGRVEGAAGSLYVSVPVALHGANDATEYFGNITLRRSNDVPGSTAEQRAWRIVRIDWQAIAGGE